MRDRKGEGILSETRDQNTEFLFTVITEWPHTSSSIKERSTFIPCGYRSHEGVKRIDEKPQ